MAQILKIAEAAELHRQMRLRQKLQTQRIPAQQVQATINAARGGAPTGKPKLRKAPMAGTASHKSVTPKVPTLTPIPALPSLGTQAPPPPSNTPTVRLPHAAPVPPGTPQPVPAVPGTKQKKSPLPITQQPTQPQVVGGNIPRAKTQPLLGAYGPQQAQLKAAKQQQAGVKPVPKVQQYMVDAQEKARARKHDEVAKLTAIEQLARSAEGIPQDTTAFLGGLPAPGGIALPLVLLIILFLIVLPVKGADGSIHTRAMWLWRVMTSNASLQQTSRSTEGTITPGLISSIAGTSEQILQAEAKTAHDIFTYPLHELGLVQ